MFSSIRVLGLVMLVVTLLVLAILSFISFGLMHPAPWIVLVIAAIIPMMSNKLIGSKFIAWKDEYSVGVAEMDNEHKRLINLINQLQTTVSYSTGRESEVKALDDVLDYTRTHFVNEEKLLAENDFSDIEAHKEIHQQFINKVNELAEQYKQDADATLVDAHAFLKDWLIHHINGTDKEYGKVLNAKGIH